MANQLITPIAASNTSGAGQLLVGAAQINQMWIKLASIAFADAIHDEIVSTDQTGSISPAAKTWQCGTFYNALPITTGPNCNPGPGAGQRGLNIVEDYKRLSLHGNGIELNTFCFVSYGTRPAYPALLQRTIDDIMTHSTGGHQYPFNTSNGKRYTVRTISWGPGAVPATHPTVRGEGLMQSLGMEDGSAILVDFQNNKMLTQFKSGPASPWVLYQLMTPEYLADSAPRTRWRRTNKLYGNNGVRWAFAGKYQSNYPPWTNASRNTFFSRYSCQMITDWGNGRCGQTWSLAGTVAAGGGELFTTPDANTANNRSNVSHYNPPAGPQRNNRNSLKFQRKRSGDQFQALAVKRLTNTTRFNISNNGHNPPDNTSTYNGVLMSGAGVQRNPKGYSYLITHDLVLLAYALHLGINVIFSRTNGGTKTAMSFKIATGNPAAGNLNDNTN